MPLLDIDQTELRYQTFQKDLVSAIENMAAKLGTEDEATALARLDMVMLSDRLIIKEIKALEAHFSDLAGAEARKRGFTRKRKAALHEGRMVIRTSRKHWAGVRRTLIRTMAAETTDLYPYRDLDMAAFSGGIDVLVRAFDHIVNPAEQDEEARERGQHADIRMAITRFNDHLHAAHRLLLAMRRPRPWRFIDVGCGGGVKVIAATAFVDEGVGLEYDPGYAAAAKRLCDAAPANVSAIEGDALTFDDYGQFDIIYAYQPLADMKLLAEMEDRIAAQARPGTIVIAPYDHIATRAAGIGLARVCRSILIAGISQEDCEEITAEAERMGPNLLTIATKIPQRLEQWEPLIEACRMRGYDPLFTIKRSDDDRVPEERRD